MATKSKSIEEYIERRVRELIAAGWPDWQIIQQLEAVVGGKKVVEEIARQRKLTALGREAVGITRLSYLALTPKIKQAQ